MVAIASRSSWSPRYADGDKTLSGLAVEVFVHHTVTKQLLATATVEQERAQMRAIEQVGKSRGFPGISYNVVIFPSGRAYQGVSWNRRGTHTGGRNSTARSICFAGNYETNQPTAAQIATAAAIYAQGKGKWWTKGAPLRGHLDVKITACPGRNVYARLGEIRAGGTPAPAPTPSGITEDGKWGKDTTRALQRLLGTIVDGTVSRQSSSWRSKNPGLTTGWQWVAPGTEPQGSALVKALQKWAGVTQDGKIGPGTITAIQRKLDTPADGVVSKPSKMVAALQQRVNQGRL